MRDHILIFTLLNFPNSYPPPIPNYQSPIFLRVLSDLCVSNPHRSRRVFSPSNHSIGTDDHLLAFEVTSAERSRFGRPSSFLNGKERKQVSTIPTSKGREVDRPRHPSELIKPRARPQCRRIGHDQPPIGSRGPVVARPIEYG